MPLTKNRPDFRRAERVAQETLLCYAPGKLPVRLATLIRAMPGIRLRDYGWFSRVNACHAWDVPKLANSADGCSWWMPERDRFLILYNQQAALRRARWTIAHELGHCLLRHHEQRLGRGDGQLYSALEAEANAFAAALLAPASVLLAIGDLHGQRIKALCGISAEAAAIARATCERRALDALPYGTADALTAHFASFIESQQMPPTEPQIAGPICL